MMVAAEAVVAVLMTTFSICFLAAVVAVAIPVPDEERT